MNKHEALQRVLACVHDHATVALVDLTLATAYADLLLDVRRAALEEAAQAFDDGLRPGDIRALAETEGA